MYKPELLSPVGDFECLKAAVQNGANSVYLGASAFSARARATNFGHDELKQAIIYAKSRGVEVHLALNTLIKNSEFDEAVSLAVEAYNYGVDAIIIQDIGLAKYLLENYPEIPLHASTQMTVHNLAGVKQLEALGFKRVVLSRELSLKEIEYIKENSNIEIEVFIHGALCISYSGQCLLSSMIGGRSGNRGLCAQPCRMPYSLIEENKQTNVKNELDSGYILSPRDNCAIELLPELIKLGIDSFKIEGRMKTPLYVATVTRIYRKYIDLVLNNISKDNEQIRKMINESLDKVNPDTGLSDREELLQVFNRGGFSKAHFMEEANRNLIYSKKPNNIGTFIGKIQHINESKGHLTLKLENPVSVGDKIMINDDMYTISELMIKNKNFPTMEAGKVVTIGRMKGKLSVGKSIYKMEDSNMVKVISPSYRDDTELVKVKINASLSIKEGAPMVLSLKSNSKYYSDIETTTISSFVPEKAISNPATKESILEKINKTGNTEFEFESIDLDLDEGLFVQVSALNNLRRDALSSFKDEMIMKNTHKLVKKDVYELNDTNLNSDKKISLLLNILDTSFDYNSLHNIDRIYIPLKYYADSNYDETIKKISEKYPIYLYMPIVVKDTKRYYDLDAITNKFNLSGFVVSHISQIEEVKKYNKNIIGNYSLNVYSDYSIDNLKKLNINECTLSPEINNTTDINDVFEKSSTPLEVIAYGKIPVMTNNYCYLGKSNKCYKDCDRKCLNSSCKYYLKDKLDSEYTIIPDNHMTITTIYSSKPLDIDSASINASSIRIDILDESLETIQKIIDNK